MFYGIRTSSYEAVARKFRPSIVFDWQYCLQTAMIRTTAAQRWCLVGTSVARMKAAELVESLISPQGQYEVSSPIGRTLRVSKNFLLSVSILSVQ